MAVVHVKGFATWQDRKPPYKWRCRHRKTGTMIDTEKFQLGSLAFFAECARIVALNDKTDDPKPGTLGQLIARYRASVFFTDLAARTRADYQRCFDYLQPIADTMLDRFTPPLVVKIRDKAAAKHGRRFGNYVKTVLALTFAWGVERGYLKVNPAMKIKGIRRPRGMADANRPWSDSERDAVAAA
ncbi:MAG: integrase, partial [Mesorhizobium sp.]